MKAKFKATVTITSEYEADSVSYGCDDAEEMIEMDIDNFNKDPEIFIMGLLDEGAKAEITIKEVK